MAKGVSSPAGSAALSRSGAAKGGALERASSSNSNGLLALTYCVLLALQFGLQPTLVKSFTPNDISKKTIVIATEVSKILITFVTVATTEAPQERAKILQHWTPLDSLEQAAVPAVLYALQNVLTQYGYQLLDSMTFNLLNQTKILSSALCLYLAMNVKQSLRQCVALVVLLLAALLLSLPKDLLSVAATTAFAAIPSLTAQLKAADYAAALKTGITLPQTIISALTAAAAATSSGSVKDGALYRNGVLCVLGASMLSGICAMLTQRTLQQSKRHALFYSAEMAVYGIVALLLSTVGRVDSDRLSVTWDVTGGLGELANGISLEQVSVWGSSPAWVLIPVFVNACGGLIVGLVVKYAGGVNKGFAVIAGLFLSGLVQWVHEKKPLGPFDFIAAGLVMLSLYMHTSKGWGSGQQQQQQQQQQQLEASSKAKKQQ